MVFAALVGGLVGSRLDFIIENYSDVKHDLLGNLFSGSGLVWYGGAIGGAIGVVLWAWWRGLLNARPARSLRAPALALGYAIGRIGCQLSGDGDYGKAWNGPWAMAYPRRHQADRQTVHPTPIYETLAMGLVAYRALAAPRPLHGPASSSPSTCCSPGTERFLVEFIRRNERRRPRPHPGAAASAWR